MPDARPGGALNLQWSRLASGHVELYLQDKEHGGGTRIQFQSPAWAQVFIDDLERNLAELSVDEVLGS